MKKPHILIVDDDPLNIKLLERILWDTYKLSIAENGQQAIEIANSANTPDLILLDIMMPEIDGYETCQRLKANSQTIDIPIIFITAHTEESAEIKGIELGAVDFITKPFNRTIVKVRIKNHIDLKKHRDLLQENEKILRTIMDTVETGGLIIDADNFKIIDANRFAARMIGCEKETLRGRDCRDFMCLEQLKSDKASEQFLNTDSNDCDLKTVHERIIQVRWSYAKIKIKEQDCFLISFSNITDIKELLKKQDMNINQAKKILAHVNGRFPRYIDLSDELSLFCSAVTIPCNSEGGDHFFIKNLNLKGPEKSPKTIISIKDQSGHEVGCVLRSIYTDILHKSVINGHGDGFLEKSLDKLNNEICGSGIFNEEDFFTSIVGEIDHSSLTFRYVSAGHPPFILIRGVEVECLPELEKGHTNLPMAIISGVKYSADEIKLQAGDKLIFYTDGLSEMPSRNCSSVLGIDKLKSLVAKIIEKDSEMPASEIMENMLKKVAEISREEVIPDLKNTSGDDVTILCIEIEKKLNCQQIRIKPSNSEDLCRKMDQLYRELEQEWYNFGYASPQTRLRSVMEEAVLNAWHHGNNKNPAKSITLRWRYGNDFHLEIIDEGHGYDFENYPDPRSVENRLKPFGRGLFLIGYYADSVQWQKDGSHLHVYFQKQKKRLP